jgi:hypothetical protein
MDIRDILKAPILILFSLVSGTPRVGDVQMLCQNGMTDTEVPIYHYDDYNGTLEG